jgi:hypothetical protein
MGSSGMSICLGVSTPFNISSAIAYFACLPTPSLSIRKGSEIFKSLAIFREVDIMPCIVLFGVSPLQIK